ncbi:MAG: ATP-binding protein [Anaerolineae bacterium]|nr:ATP-binding protein [Anaerolineae bacterium]
MTTRSLKELCLEFAAKYHIPINEAAMTYDAPPVQCEVCQDRGFYTLDVPFQDERFGKTFECEAPNCEAAARLRQARYAKLATLSQLPEEYRQWTFANWQEPYHQGHGELLTGKWLGFGAAAAFTVNRKNSHYFTLAQAYKWVQADTPADTPDTPKNSLVLQGAPGTGKTSLAACVVNALLADQVAVVYTRVSDVLAAVKERFSRQQEADYVFDYGNSADAVKDIFKKAPVLVLDEFNLSKYSDFDRQCMEDIVRFRMAGGLPLVATCNITFDEFQDPTHWDYRTGHAVQGMAHWVTVGGAELRPRNGAIQSI